MLKISEYTKDNERYLKFAWDTGYLEILKIKWDKLSKRKKDLILNLGVSNER